MTGGIIFIHFDCSHSNQLTSYVETLQLIEQKEESIHTNCLDFFDFYYLMKGYDVKVIKGSGDYILLSELLDDKENRYTRRIIKKTHNVKRLLTSNELEFKTPENKREMHDQDFSSMFDLLDEIEETFLHDLENGWSPAEEYEQEIKQLLSIAKRCRKERENECEHFNDR